MIEGPSQATQEPRGISPSLHRGRGDTWVLSPSVGEDPGPLQEGEKQAADLEDFSPKLLCPPRASSKAGFSRCLLELCSHVKMTITRELQKIKVRDRNFCPQTHPAIAFDVRHSLLRPLIQTFPSRQHQPWPALSKLDALLSQSRHQAP